jgi:hypothetical protein
MILKSIGISFVTLMIWVGGTSSQRSQDGSRLELDGVVIARELAPLTLVTLTFVPNSELFLVRLEPCDGCKEKAQYIKVLYLHWHNESSLPAEMFETKNFWHFKVIRRSNCDGSIKALEPKSDSSQQRDTSLPRVIWMPWIQVQNVPTDVVLPCYELHPHDFHLKEGKGLPGSE